MLQKAKTSKPLPKKYLEQEKCTAENVRIMPTRTRKTGANANGWRN